MTSPSNTQTGNGSNGQRARYVFPRCAALRAGKGLKKRQLATLAAVDPTTLSRIERQEPVTIETAMAVFNQIDLLHGNSLNAQAEVIELKASGPAGLGAARS